MELLECGDGTTVSRPSAPPDPDPRPSPVPPSGVWESLRHERLDGSTAGLTRRASGPVRMAGLGLGPVGLGLGRLQRGHHDLRLHRLPDLRLLRSWGGRQAGLGPGHCGAADRPAGPGARAAVGPVRPAQLLADGQHRARGAERGRDVLRHPGAGHAVGRPAAARRRQHLLRVRLGQLQRDAQRDLDPGHHRTGLRARLGAGLHRRHRAAAHRLLRPDQPRGRHLRHHRRQRPRRAGDDAHLRGLDAGLLTAALPHHPRRQGRAHGTLVAAGAVGLLPPALPHGRRPVAHRPQHRLLPAVLGRLP